MNHVILTAVAMLFGAVQEGEVTLLKKTELLTAYRLRNGLEVILVRNRTVPLVTVEIAVRTGAYTETPRTDGLAHLYEHMFFKGNAALPSQEAYQKREAELGIRSNGTTSTEAVKYFITLPGKNFEQGMEFMAHALLMPLFEAGELKKETKVVLGEYDRNEADPSFFLRKSVRQRLFHAYYYRKNPIGDRDSILAATPALLRDFKDRYYVPNNSALIIEGDFDPTHALAMARHYFGPHKWKRGPNPHEHPLPAHPPIGRDEFVIVNKPFQQAIVKLGQYGPNVRKDDQETWDTYVADVLGTLLALPQSKFQRNLVDSGLCAAASWSYFTQRDGGEIDFTTVCAPARVGDVAKAMRAELAKFQDFDYFTEADLKAAQRRLEVDSTFGRERGQQFAVDLAFWWAVAGTDYFLDYVPNIKRVTIAELRRFAKRWILGRPSVTGVLISKENQAKTGLTLKSLGAVDGAENRDTGARLIRLDNGLRVVHKRVKTNEVVSLQLFLEGGSRNIREGNAGVEYLMLQALLKGSKKYPKAVFQSKLAGLGARVGADSAYDYSVLSLKCLKSAFPECLDLIADAVKEPLFEEAEIARLRDRMARMLSAQDSDPNKRIAEVCNSIFFADHPYSASPKGTPASVRSLTRDQVVEHHRSFLNSWHALLVVVGDVDLNLVKRAFESLPDRGSRSLGKLLPVAPAKEVRLRIENREIPTAYVLGKFPAPSPADPDYPALKVGLDILADRLWEAVRTKAALSYAVFSGMAEFGANYGYLYVTSVKPNDAIRLMYQEVRRIQDEPTPAGDVRAGALKLYTGHFMRNEPNDGQASSLGRGVLLGGGEGLYDRVMERITHVTPEEVRAAMRKYLRHCRFGILGPEKWIDRAVFKKGR